MNCETQKADEKLRDGTEDAPKENDFSWKAKVSKPRNSETEKQMHHNGTNNKVSLEDRFFGSFCFGGMKIYNTFSRLS